MNKPYWIYYNERRHLFIFLTFIIFVPLLVMIIYQISILVENECSSSGFYSTELIQTMKKMRRVNHAGFYLKSKNDSLIGYIKIGKNIKTITIICSNNECTNNVQNNENKNKLKVKYYLTNNNVNGTILNSNDISDVKNKHIASVGKRSIVQCKSGSTKSNSETELSSSNDLKQVYKNLERLQNSLREFYES